MNTLKVILLVLCVCFEECTTKGLTTAVLQHNWTMNVSNDSSKPSADGNSRDVYAHQWETKKGEEEPMPENAEPGKAGRGGTAGSDGDKNENNNPSDNGDDSDGEYDNQYSADMASIAHSYLSGVVIPIIGLLGVLGNLLNLAILSWRCLKKDDDTLEKVALVGLIALAVSDLCFCITILPYLFVPKPTVVYQSLGFAVYYQLYGEYAQNVFIKTSTWLTMIVATARYIAICHPLKARFCFGIRPTRIAIVCTYAFWATFSLPLLWSLKVSQHQIDANNTLYILDHGPFTKNKPLHHTFTYLWAIFGYFIPVFILGFCNVCLIKALRESRRLRQTVAHTARGQNSYNSRKSSNRITLTLIALVLMFIVLVSPSEILHFCSTVSPGTFAAYEIAMVVANVLQAFNFALHFVLYCIVNVTFRRTLVLLALSFYRCIRGRPSRGSGASGLSGMSHTQLTRRSTLTATNLRSTDTHLCDHSHEKDAPSDKQELKSMILISKGHISEMNNQNDYSDMVV